MNTQVCVICSNKKPINQTNNRLVTESCGHVKCMDCLLREKAGCQACRGNSNGAGEDKTSLCSEVLLTVDESSSIAARGDLNKKKKPETSHITVETVPGGGRCYVCTVCKKRFHARSQVAYHAYCNGQLKPYQCPECNKSFATLSHYKYHMRVHRNERTYACDVCGDSFFQMSKLQRHKLKHTKEKKYVCGQCNKAFNNVTSLRKHGLTHTEERPYACAACGRRFRDGSNYRKHLAKHDASPAAGARCGGRTSARAARRPSTPARTCAGTRLCTLIQNHSAAKCATDVSEGRTTWSDTFVIRIPITSPRRLWNATRAPSTKSRAPTELPTPTNNVKSPCLKA